MRAKSDWERVRSPHARFLEGLQAAVASHPSASSGRVGAKKPRLTLVGAPDNVIQLRDRKPRSHKRGGGTPAA
jgi:hypothetical protein